VVRPSSSTPRRSRSIRTPDSEQLIPRRPTGRRAIVTGAGAGISRAIALRFAAGAQVIVAEPTSTPRARSSAASASPRAHQVDVSREASVAAMVNNLGIGIAATTPDTDARITSGGYFISLTFHIRRWSKCQ
jgi:hypothetical protein